VFALLSPSKLPFSDRTAFAFPNILYPGPNPLDRSSSQLYVCAQLGILQPFDPVEIRSLSKCRRCVNRTTLILISRALSGRDNPLKIRS
jgi:hypothetical protein